MKGVISLSLVGLLTSVVWGWDEDDKNPSEVWGRSKTEAAMIHGVSCMCVGCQEIRVKELDKCAEESRKWQEERKAKQERRAEWDRELKAMGVGRWSYSAVTKFKSPRVKATIVFANGRVINFNQKLKHTQPVPTPVDIARSAR